jgi:hypothetical protein
MSAVVELGRFLVPTDRGVVTIQSSSIEIDEADLIPGLTQAVAQAGCYQLWISSIAKDLVKISVTAYRITASTDADGEPGEVVCDRQPVDFYDETGTIRALTLGIDLKFTLSDGAGQPCASSGRAAAFVGAYPLLAGSTTTTLPLS